MRYLLVILWVILSAAPSSAFVEKLHPNVGSDGEGIPCHGIGATLRFFISPSGPVPAVLSSIIQREWVPGGWSAQDTADNLALITMLDGLTQAEKEMIVGRLEDFCMLWEMDVDEVNSPQEYRQRVGLPAAP